MACRKSATGSSPAARASFARYSTGRVANTGVAVSSARTSNSEAVVISRFNVRWDRELCMTRTNRRSSSSSGGKSGWCRAHTAESSSRVTRL